MVKVIALGNILRGDDGVGPAVLDYLRFNGVSEKAQLIEAGSDAFAVLDHLLQPEPVILIDCARMGKAPGDVRIFHLSEITLTITEQLVSLHGFSMAEVYQMARKMGPVADCVIIGIEPGSVEFNQELTGAVRESIPAAAQLVNLEMKRYAEKNNYN